MVFAVRLERTGPWDWSRTLREQEGWDEHARFMDALVDEGFVILGGPLDGNREVLLVISARPNKAPNPRLQLGPLSAVRPRRVIAELRTDCADLELAVGDEDRDQPARARPPETPA